jgi:hypothetical protein
MTLEEEFHQKREQFISGTIDLLAKDPSLPNADRRQFIAGYFYVLQNMAGGNRQPLEEYIATAVPGAKAANVPLAGALQALNTIHMYLARAVSQENYLAMTRITTEYVKILYETWSAA